MDLATLLLQDGYAQQHGKSAMQEIARRILDLFPAEVSSISLIVDEEANDWNQSMICVCTGGTIKAWVELSSDGINRPGQYRFRLLATLDEEPLPLGMSEAAWIQGQGESHLDDLIAQLSAIELYAPEAAMIIFNTIYP